jgi:hypothetical protein
MFNKFQQKIKNIIEDVSSNSTSGGVFGPNATQDTFSSTPIKVDMAIAGGSNPPKKKYKKSKKRLKKPFFPIIKRNLPKEL